MAGASPYDQISKTYFGSVLERLRLEKNWPLEYVAYRVGIRKQHYWRIEQKGIYPSWMLVQRFALLFEVSTEIFVDKSVAINDPWPVEPSSWLFLKNIPTEKVELLCQLLARRPRRRDTLTAISMAIGIKPRRILHLLSKPEIIGRVKQITAELEELDRQAKNQLREEERQSREEIERQRRQFVMDKVEEIYAEFGD